MIIAIDGTTSSGKGTLAKRLAAHFGLPHLDTGLLYRAVAAKARREGVAMSDAAACAHLAHNLVLRELEAPELRSSLVGAEASVVAAHSLVRHALLDLQRAFARQTSGAVLDGRDIGTVIAPDAGFKFWVDASLEERARRRYLELLGQGEAVTPDGVLAQLKERDGRDAGRKDAPSKPADDAVRIDTTALNPDQTEAAAMHVITRHRL
jgi:CMP/dCMP kinase